VKEGGFFGLYRGFGPTLLGILPYAGISFFCYDSMKALYKTTTGTDVMPIYLRLGIGGLAGAIAQTVSYPLDVVRRRMQVETLALESSDATLKSANIDHKPLGNHANGHNNNHQTAMNGEKPKFKRIYTNTWTSLRYIIRTEGVKGLFLGLSINYIKVAPTVGIYFATYDYMKNIFDNN